MRDRGAVPASFLLPGWLRAPCLSIGAAKEFHEILPCWLVGMLTSLGWPVAAAWPGEGMAWAFYLAGELAVVAMGAAIFGHEFAHGTMLLTLSQPRTRHEVWWRKLQVLGVATGLVALVRLAGPVLHGASPATIVSFAGFMSVSALGYGLLVAPVFALWSRSTLAATVFTAALPIVTWQVVSLVAALPHGLENRESSVVQETAAAYFVLAMIGEWLLGPLLGYRAFLRLQATASRGVPIRLPAFLGRAAVSGTPRRSPRGSWAMLGAKEVRLLAPAYLVAALYLLLAVSDVALRRGWGGVPIAVGRGPDFLTTVTLMYGVLVSLLVGSLACAEDRHAGTLQWHLVQPVALWRQWLVKSGTALALVLVLAIGLPRLVFAVEGTPGLVGRFGTFPPAGIGGAALQVLALSTLALYISTLTGSAMRAMLWAAPIGLALETLAWGLLDSPAVQSSLWNWFVPFETDGRSLVSPAGVVWVLFWGVLVAGFFLTALACAGRNFRSLDQSVSRVVAHAGLLVGYGLFAGAACFSFKSVMNAAGASLPMRPETVAERQAAACRENVNEIGNAVCQWALAHEHRVPGTLAELTNELASPQVLVCPADKTRQAAADWAAWNPGQVTYSYAPQPGVSPPAWTAEVRCPVHGTHAAVGTVLARYGLSPDSADDGGSGGSRTLTNAWRMDPRMLIRYGLLPKPTQPEGTSANPPRPIR